MDQFPHDDEDDRDDYDAEEAYEQHEAELVDRAYAAAQDEYEPMPHPDDVSANARRAARYAEQVELARWKHAAHVSQRELQALHIKAKDMESMLADADKTLRAYRDAEVAREERIAKLVDEVATLRAELDAVRGKRGAA